LAPGIPLHQFFLLLPNIYLQTVFFVLKYNGKTLTKSTNNMKKKALLLLLSAGLIAGCHPGTSKDNDDDDMDTTAGTVVHNAGSQVYNLNNKAAVKTAQLNLETSAINVNLSDTTGKLFNAVVNDTTRKFVLSQQTAGPAEVVDFMMKEHNRKYHNDSASVELRLNASPQWDIKAKAGATKCNFDLSKFKISKFQLTCAAGEVNVKLAPVLDNTNVEINATVADVTIRIPQDAACEVHLESTLADNDFQGFRKKDDNHYETSGFATAQNKIHIKANCSLSSFKIVRY
jgi:hypothetical protein